MRGGTEKGDGRRRGGRAEKKLNADRLEHPVWECELVIQLRAKESRYVVHHRHVGDLGPAPTDATISPLVSITCLDVNAPGINIIRRALECPVAKRKHGRGLGRAEQGLDGEPYRRGPIARACVGKRRGGDSEGVSEERHLMGRQRQRHWSSRSRSCK